MATKIMTQEAGQVLANKIKANTTSINAHQSSITTMQTAIAALQAGTYDDTALQNRISANETALATLNGTGAGSVQKTVDDRIAEVVANAPADFDTLKEISDWISGHADDASAMNSQIQTNATNITAAQSSITTLQAALAAIPEYETVSATEAEAWFA